VNEIERLARRDRWLLAFIPKFHTVVCTWMVVGTLVALVDLFASILERPFLPMLVAGIHCLALVVVGTAHHLLLRYHLRLRDRLCDLIERELRCRK
jgi:hypothetical protein